MPCSAWLRSRTEHSSHSIVHRLLPGTQSCGLDVIANRWHIWCNFISNFGLSGPDSRCKRASPHPAQTKLSTGRVWVVAQMAPAHATHVGFTPGWAMVRDSLLSSKSTFVQNCQCISLSWPLHASPSLCMLKIPCPPFSNKRLNGLWYENRDAV